MERLEHIITRPGVIEGLRKADVGPLDKALAASKGFEYNAKELASLRPHLEPIQAMEEQEYREAEEKGVAPKVSNTTVKAVQMILFHRVMRELSDDRERDFIGRFFHPITAPSTRSRKDITAASIEKFGSRQDALPHIENMQQIVKGLMGDIEREINAVKDPGLNHFLSHHHGNAAIMNIGLQIFRLELARKAGEHDQHDKKGQK